MSLVSQDNLIAEDRLKYRVTGGCTVLVALFICGKLFVANAGDSRAVLCRGSKAFPLSNDFTPETERQRIRKLAALQPELLGGEYTALDYSRRPNRYVLLQTRLKANHSSPRILHQSTL